MIIKEIYIGAFGGLRERSYRFSDGVNLIEGHNEAGKSTLCAFIKFIFFGLAAKGKNNPLPDRRRYMPFDAGSVHGTLTLSDGDKDYRISRTLTMTGKTAARDEYTVTDLATGEPAFDGAAPCDIFLGMNEGLFTRTAYVPQLTGTTVDGTEVTTAIENLLFSAEEEIDSAKALRILDSGRAQLLHKSEKGGRLYEARAERDAVAARLALARGAKENLARVEEQLNALRKSEAENTRLLSEAQQSLAKYEIAKSLAAFDEADGQAEHIRALQEKRSGLCVNGSPPSSEDILALIRLAEAMKNGEADLEKAENIPAPETPDAPIARDGGETEVSARLRRARRTAKGRRAFGILALIAAVACTAAGGAGAAELLPLPAYAPPSLLGGGVVCAAAGIVLLLMGARAEKSLRQTLERYGLNRIGDLGARVHQEENDRLLYEKALSDRAARRARLEEEQRAREADARILCERYATPYTGAPCLEDLAVRLTALRENCAALDAQIEKEIERAEAHAQDLAALDRAELTERLGTDPYEVMATLNEKDLKNRLALGEAGKDKMRERISELEKEQIEARAAAREEDQAADALARLSTDIDILTKRYDALRLAYDSMERAAETVKEHISPTLAKRAGELLGRATGGKYERLFVSHDLALTYADGAGGTVRDAEYLSRGTKDLAYVALRLALCELLAGKRKLPMIFDESFAAMDDGRLARIYAVIADRDAQSLIFTSQHRDRGLLPDANVIEM